MDLEMRWIPSSESKADGQPTKIGPDGRARMLLDVRDLCIDVYTSYGPVRVVNQVSLDIHEGEIHGIVGESGSGKTMTALSIIRLLPKPTVGVASGTIAFKDVELTALSEKEMREVRGKCISMVFQDPILALDPIMAIGNQVMEAVSAHRSLPREEARTRALELLASVGIPDGELRLSQYPFEMSGGMRQRIMIAIALAGEPMLLIADEPTTNLDVSIQAEILILLKNIRDATGCAVLFITHNLGIINWICDRVTVMYAGEVVERGYVKSVINRPMHPYTKLLLKAVPEMDDTDSELESIPGDIPRFKERPEGCIFYSRCPYQKEVCKSVHPGLVKTPMGQDARCLMYNQEYSHFWD
jgi:oligopeptide/dipeptide ABC transporter ATP-binding protein